MNPKPNVFDGPIDNEFAIIKSVLDHRDRMERDRVWDVQLNGSTDPLDIMEMIQKYMKEINKRPMYKPMPLDPVEPYWIRQQPMIPLRGRRDSIFIIDDPLNRSENS